MKKSNATIFQQLQEETGIFRAARRSDVVMKIRLKMTEKGLRNVDLAERIGVSEANISRWLKGNQNLSIDTIYLLADAIEEPLSIELGRAADVLTHEMHHGSHCGEACNAEYIEDEVGDLCVGETVIALRAYAKIRPESPLQRFAFKGSKANIGLEILVAP